MSETSERGSGNRDIISIRGVIDNIPLILDIEKQVISIMIVNGLVKVNNIYEGNLDDYTFDNISLTNKGIELVNSSNLDTVIGTLSSALGSVNVNTVRKGNSISEEQLQEYRDIFPTGAKGPKQIVKFRLEKFMRENNCTFDEVLAAANLYVKHNTSKGYNVAQAHYFLAKKDPDSKINESRCEEFLEEVRKKGINNSPDWRDKLV